MYVHANKWDNAYKVISRYLPESEYKMLYIKEAQKFEKEAHYKDAERMYLTANEPDLAINMYKKAKQYDHMIRLVTKYRKDLLKETHLHLAQQLDLEGNLKQAEHHYIESEAWHGAVDMYRAHDMWEEALRVAKTNGSAKEVGDIALKVAENMGAQGQKFLIKNGLVEAAIDFEANKNNFDEAFKLANGHARYKLPDVHLKYALQLEDEKRFKKAEDEFIKANKPTEAISMYEHQQDWHSALQVARQFHPESVSLVFINQGKFYLERKEYAKAEGCFINAKAPKMAINAYEEAGMLGEALRVAQKHDPSEQDRLNMMYSEGRAGRGDATGEEIYKSAKMWEDSREYSKAIDGYLEITEAHFHNMDTLEEIWERAYTLAMTHAKDRIQEVVSIIGNRLIKIKRFVSAAEIFESVGYYEKAVDAYIGGKDFGRAMEIANQVRSPDIQHHLVNKINKARRAHDIENENYDELGGDEGLEILAQKGDWNKCLALAEKQGSEVLNRYLLRYTKMLLQEGQFKSAAQAFVRYGCPAIQAIFPFYKTIALEILTASKESELGTLKEMLQKLCDVLLLQVDRGNPVFREFYEYLFITHLLLMKEECARNPQLLRIYTRVCISLLRYTKIVRADKAFLDAGNACKKEGILNMAFVFLNRYLDLAEAIEDPDSAQLSDNLDFQGTDVPSPFDIPLPETNLLSEAQREEIRDWVLQISMENKVEQVLSFRNCEECGTDIYEVG